MTILRSSVPLGLISLDYGPWREVVSAARQWGCDLVELYVDVSLVEDDIDDVIDTTTAHGIEVSSVSCLARLAQPEDAEELSAHSELVRRSIRMAAQLRAPFATLMHGGCGSLDRERALERFVDRLQPLLNEAEDYGVTLLVENVFSRAVPGDLDDVDATVAALEILCERNVWLNLDLGNFAVAGARAVPDAWERLIPFARSLHLKSVERYDPRLHGELDGRRPLDGRVHGRHVSVPVDRGLVDYGPVLARLAEGDLQVPVLLEPFAGGVRRDRWIEMSLNALERHGVVVLANEGTPKYETTTEGP